MSALDPPEDASTRAARLRARLRRRKATERAISELGKVLGVTVSVAPDDVPLPQVESCVFFVLSTQHRADLTHPGWGEPRRRLRLV